MPATDGFIDAAGHEALPPALLSMMMTANRIMATEAVRAVPDGRLTPPQFRILNYLFVAPGASLSEVAAYLGVRLPTASVMMVKLAAEGYVLRSRHPSSRRRMQLVLTEQGQAVTTSVRNALFNRLGSGLDRLETSERAVLHDAIPALRRLFSLV
ncbi:MarR family winged helix-turn-helix transcriptional regulator [Roseicella aquatilis]|nr:MarR family transcriptional regulator [Roseicella aquatilis]